MTRSKYTDHTHTYPLPHFIQNFILLSTSYAANFSFLLYSIILYFVLFPEKLKKYFFILFAILIYILVIFPRYNGIVQAFPACLTVIYLFLKNKNLQKKSFIAQYILWIIISSVISICIAILPYKTLPMWDKMDPAQHILCNQLAGICVPANDSSCFDNNWYVEGKNWNDLKREFNKYPTNADYIAYHDTNSRVIAPKEAKGLRKKLIKAMFKYPDNWIKHEKRLIKEMWFAPMFFVKYTPPGSKSPFYYNFNFDEDYKYEILSDFPEAEYHLYQTPLKLKLLHIWDDYLPKIPTIGWVSILFIMCILSFIVLFFTTNNLIVYCFILSFSGFLASLIYGGIYPNVFPRYMLPLWAQSICCIIILAAFVFDIKKNKE